MKKLIEGIVEFRKYVQGSYREKFSSLAARQDPDSLFIACSDSRVVPNTFASTNPGDLFVIRNVGNLIPKCGVDGICTNDKSEAAAIEYSVQALDVADIIVCGHSECGAMQAMLNNKDCDGYHLKNWLSHADSAVSLMSSELFNDSALSPVNRLSQINVLEQLENVKSYPVVQKRLKEGKLRLHGWWFDLAGADVYAFDKEQRKFILIDEVEGPRILNRIT